MLSVNHFRAAPRHVVRLAVPGLALALAACSNSDTTLPLAGSQFSVSFAASPASGNRPNGISASRDIATSTNSAAVDTVILTKVQLVLSHVELERVDQACASSTQGGDAEANEQEHHGDCNELSLAPILVDVPLTASAKTAVAAVVPAGTYTSLHARIDALKKNDKQVGADAFATAHPEFAGTSIRVEGTYKGTPFVYTTDTKAEVFVAFKPPITVTGDAAPNVTIAVDPSLWFRTESGAPIDPTTTGPGQPNNRTIADNIRRSFRGFRDDDHDGRGDHEDEGQH